MDIRCRRCKEEKPPRLFTQPGLATRECRICEWIHTPRVGNSIHMTVEREDVLAQRAETNVPHWKTRKAALVCTHCQKRPGMWRSRGKLSELDLVRRADLGWSVFMLNMNASQAVVLCDRCVPKYRAGVPAEEERPEALVFKSKARSMAMLFKHRAIKETDPKQKKLWWQKHYRWQAKYLKTPVQVEGVDLPMTAFRALMFTKQSWLPKPSLPKAQWQEVLSCFHEMSNEGCSKCAQPLPGEWFYNSTHKWNSVWSMYGMKQADKKACRRFVRHSKLLCAKCYLPQRYNVGLLLAEKRRTKLQKALQETQDYKEQRALERDLLSYEAIIEAEKAWLAVAPADADEEIDVDWEAFEKMHSKKRSV